MSFSQVIQAWFLTPILNEIKKVEAKMSALSDQITALGGQLGTVETTVTQLGTDLTAEIVRLQALIAAGNVTPADLTNLQALGARMTTIVTTLQGLDTQATGA